MMLPQLPGRESWKKTNKTGNPFLRWEFMQALEQSGSIGEKAGWLPLHFKYADDSFLYTFIKGHSYGEFIFDWGWAEAYERYGIPYYPKLTSMIPFTPVSTSHFMFLEKTDDKKIALLKTHDEFLKNSHLSSAHFLFVGQEDLSVYQENGYHLRKSLQYHFYNNHQDFDGFLSTLKGKKAKTIREERKFPDLVIKKFTQAEINEDHAERMYEYYLLTIENKNSYAYLKKDFFKLVFASMPEQILFVEAYLDGNPVAGSLFFYDEEKLYGRYWGSKKYIHNLHFELCYYQGIDFCIDKKLKVFEAGAQGEHKIARGFVPTIVYSSHKLSNPSFHDAVGTFIQQEIQVIERNKTRLMDLLPFKK